MQGYVAGASGERLFYYSHLLEGVPRSSNKSRQRKYEKKKYTDNSFKEDEYEKNIQKLY